MKFITIGCLAALFSLSSALRISKSHKQEEAAPATVAIDEAKKELKDQFKETFNEMKQQFKQIDTDGDDIWTREEFDKFYEAGGNTEERDKSWTMFNTNEDEQVTFEEFKTEMKKKLKELVNAEVDKIKSADTDGDGVISAEEAAAVPGGVAVAPLSPA